jgi:hypothetical protein
MNVERIKFEQTGGFTGMRIAADFELGDLSEEDAHTLTELLDDVDFDELPENLMSGPSMPDQFNYTITVEGKLKKHTVTTGDASAPEKLQELLQLLTRIARKQAKKRKEKQ